ncbi:hypothetical protein GJU43_09835 [Flavobacterium sp. LC2016-23]|uniref:DUF6705 family protein n=1 Tax=Flavobacterium sp. LC2016-23 TaxID=2666330 RepID=UPI0012B0F1ED|nr:DUF6705 family protein [Flavobacterium sp. LC2016-23]MRX39576.1 hypothetical protein [Flavobacterium sp. LC2016-23]
MKKIIIALSIILITLSCKAQQIVPLETKLDEAPIGTYFKDSNGLLTKYIGTWKGTYENKNYTFIVTKYKDEFRGVFSDRLSIRYLITSNAGVILQDTRSLSDENNLVIAGLYFGENFGYYVLSYSGENAQCGQSGDLFISTSKDNKQMKLYLATSHDIINASKCPKVAEQILPTKSMFLNKQ